MARTPLKVGLTGNIGSGKSTVAARLVALGAALIDSDALAKRATQDRKVLQQIASKLGEDLVENGELDRAKTAERVFKDKAARTILNEIVHPWVRRQSALEVQRLCAQPRPPKIILMDIPLLYENKLESTLDAVIVVNASLEKRIGRVMERSGLSEAEVIARDEAQLPLEEKVKRADYVIENGSSLADLNREIENLWQALVIRTQV